MTTDPVLRRLFPLCAFALFLCMPQILRAQVRTAPADVQAPASAAAPAPSPVEKPKPPVERSICLVKGENGSGSGFFAEVNGKSVLVTNTHLLLTLKDVKIYDDAGKEIPCRAFRASKTQDLALVPVDGKDRGDTPLLPLAKDLSGLTAGGRLAVYGDEHGDGAVTGAAGTFLKAEKGTFELAVPFAPFCSGGAVIDPASGNAVGAAVCMQIIRDATPAPKDAASGPVLPKVFKPDYRRFAVRLDALDPAGFDTLTMADMAPMLERFRQLDSLYGELTAALGSLSGKELFGRLQAIFTESPVPEVPGDCRSAWLKQEFERRRNELIRFRNWVVPPETGVPEPSPLLSEADWKEIQEQNLRALWTSALPDIAFRKQPAITRKCLICRGTGKVYVDNEVQKGKLQVAKRRVNCSHCNGSGTKLLRPETEHAVLSLETEQKLTSNITPVDRDLLGFRLGADGQNPHRNHPDFYHLKGQNETKAGLFTILRFPGYHRMEEAEESRFWMIGARIFRIDLIVPVKSQEDADMMIANAEQQFPKVRNAVVSAFIVRKVPAVPKRLPKNAKPEMLKELEDAETRAAADPFITFYRQDKGAAPAFVCISLRHSFFDFLQSLFKLRTRGISFGGPEQAAPEPDAKKQPDAKKTDEKKQPEHNNRKTVPELQWE